MRFDGLPSTVAERKLKFAAKERLYKLLKKHFQGTPPTTSKHEIEVKLRRLSAAKKLPKTFTILKTIPPTHLMVRKGVFQIDPSKGPTYRDACRAVDEAAKQLAPSRKDESRKSHPSNEDVNWTLGQLRSTSSEADRSGRGTIRTTSSDAIRLYQVLKPVFKGFSPDTSSSLTLARLREFEKSNDEIQAIIQSMGFWRVYICSSHLVRTRMFVNSEQSPNHDQAITAASSLPDNKEPRKYVENEVQSPFDHFKTVKQEFATPQIVSSFRPSAQQEAGVSSQAVSPRAQDVAPCEEADEINHPGVSEGPSAGPWTPLRLPDMDVVEPMRDTGDTIDLLRKGFCSSQAGLARSTAVDADSVQNILPSLMTAQTASTTEVVDSVISDTSAEIMRLENAKTPVSEHVILPSPQDLGFASNDKKELDITGLRIFESQHPSVSEPPSFTEADEMNHEIAQSQTQRPETEDNIISPTDLWSSTATLAVGTKIADAVEHDDIVNLAGNDPQQLAEGYLDFIAPPITTLQDTDDHTRLLNTSTDETQPLPDENASSGEVPALVRYPALGKAKTRRSKQKNRQKTLELHGQSAPQAAQPTTETTPPKARSDLNEDVPDDSIEDDSVVNSDHAHYTPTPSAPLKQAESKDGQNPGAQIDVESTLNSHETHKFPEFGKDYFRLLRKPRDDNRKILDEQDESLSHISQHATMPVPQIRAQFLPYSTQYRIITHIQTSLERLCFEYVERKHPDILEGTPKQWELDCPESMELTRWLQLLENPLCNNRAARRLVLKETGRSISVLWRSLATLRNFAVHRNRADIPTLQYWTGDARAFAKLLGNPETETQFANISRQLQLAARELLTNKANTEGKLLGTFKELAAKRAELDRLERKAIKGMEEESTRYKESTAAWLHESILQERHSSGSSESIAPESNAPSSPPQTGVVGWLKRWFGS
ncbi:hypothetical protein E4T42_04681 [Aureobasidium subglaciale]|nr:hypothetical protein E4T42_04681 [Aureobasidium subglaciale]